MRRILFLIIGCVSLALGAIGAVLPILPTVPFLLLAAFCFANSSQRLHTWFVGTKLYKDNLESYVKGEGMTWKTKIRILCTVTCIMAIAFVMMRNTTVGRVVLAAVWVLHILFFVFGVKTIQKSPVPVQAEESR